MNIKNYISAVMSAALAVSSCSILNASADLAADTVISRNCPAYSETDPNGAKSACDDFYYSSWSGKAGDCLVYDLSAASDEQKKKVIAVWYNATGTFDYTVGMQNNSNGELTDYTVEVNKAAGGVCPSDGWETAETVTGNTLHSREHIVDMTGYNWIRLNVSKVDGKTDGMASINFDVHSVSGGISDSWMFYGDSITACGMMNCYGTGFATYVNRLDSKYFPVQENGGIGGITSTQGRDNIDRWLKSFPGRYVSIAYGTNDAWGNQTGAAKYAENTAYMIEAVIKAGKTPILPTIPHSENPDVENNVPSYNAALEKLFSKYPELLKGPDFYSFFKESPDKLSADGVHPSDEGYDEMRKMWADWAYENVYTKESTEPTEPVTGPVTEPSAPINVDAKKGDVNADGAVNVTDMIAMGKFLTGKGTLKSYTAADMDDNKKLNVFDWIAMKRNIINDSSSGEVTETTWNSSRDYMKLQGRTVEKNNAVWLVQSGSAVEFDVTGESASVKIKGDQGIGAPESSRPRFAVVVDDKVIADELLGTKEKDIELFSGSTETTKRVRVIQLSEAMYGGVGVGSVTVKSGSKLPVKPVPKNKLNIEFIGDSITCAYGVESEGGSFTTGTENFMKSYAYLTAQALDADYSTCCYSGHGIVSGYTTGSDRNTQSLIPPVYAQCSKQQGYTDSYDFSDRKDVVVINLGTNDSSYINADSKAHLEERSEEFIEGYVDFLGTVREKNPDAYIVCTLGTMDFENVCKYADEAVQRYKKESGDKRVMFYQAQMHTQADGFGADFHPSEKTQKNISYVLADKICSALGIESKQIGLDVALEAEYSHYINTSSGANAYYYLNDYDKSVSVNFMAPGKTDSDVKVMVGGIGLKEGGSYRLEFDYSAGAEFDMPVQVVGEEVEVLKTDGTYDWVTPTYLKTKVTAGAERQHFSKEFTVGNVSGKGTIEFLMGKQGSSNVMLYNIKLTKTA